MSNNIGGYGYGMEYKYTVFLPMSPISQWDNIEWCSEHCKGKWGYVFDTDFNLILSFERDEDRFAYFLNF